MKLEELLRHVADNVEAGRPVGHGLLRPDGGKSGAMSVSEIYWSNAEEYRLAPKPHTVNGFEVPAPESDDLGYREVYYMPSHDNEDRYLRCTWDKHIVDSWRMANKQVFLTKEAAIANQKAQAFINPNCGE